MGTTAITRQLPPLGEFFAQGGLLEKASGRNYELRPSQLKMAHFVEKALVEQSHLIVEAGTGTGKTLAYIYPALRYARATGKRVILSTATKTLQDQVFYKDLPLIESIFGPIDACYLKGRRNYLCRQKLYDINPAQMSPKEAVELQQIKAWEPTTETGDRGELPELLESSSLWPRLDARTDACTGKKCARCNSCFITAMRKKAAESDLIIVNHHLFFTDMTIRMKNPDAAILPAAGAIIFDEAHELEHIASDCFGLGISNRRVADLALEIAKQSTALFGGNDLREMTGKLVDRFNLLCTRLPGDQKVDRVLFDRRGEFLLAHQELYTSILHSLTQIYRRIEQHAKADGIASLLTRTESVFSDLRYLLESQDLASVFWIERRAAGRGAALNTHIQATPIDVSEALRSGVFEHFPTAILTSATLGVYGSYQHLRRSLGMAAPCELTLSSPFDYGKQALLYLAPRMPDPRSEDFFLAASTLTRTLLEISRGRAFCLFTSYEMMNRMYGALENTVSFPLLRHGSLPRKELLDRFRATPNAVLLATSSFWQGVDIQGEQLSCIIIDRLPFAVPSDPIVQARVLAIEKAGGSGFFDYQIPRAVLALKQGFGRLIRSTRDRGVLAILDPRIQHPRYGRAFIDSLPAYATTNDIDEVARFMGSDLARKEASSTYTCLARRSTTIPEARSCCRYLPGSPVPLFTEARPRSTATALSAAGIPGANPFYS